MMIPIWYLRINAFVYRMCACFYADIYVYRHACIHTSLSILAQYGPDKHFRLRTIHLVCYSCEIKFGRFKLISVVENNVRCGS